MLYIFELINRLTSKGGEVVMQSIDEEMKEQLDAGRV